MQSEYTIAAFLASVDEIVDGDASVHGEKPSIYAPSTTRAPGPKPGGQLGSIFDSSKLLKLNGRGERI